MGTELDQRISMEIRRDNGCGKPSWLAVPSSILEMAQLVNWEVAKMARFQDSYYRLIAPITYWREASMCRRIAASASAGSRFMIAFTIAA
jgi:hypothetical protein